MPTLTPVDHDPFAAQPSAGGLTPVDYDPFAQAAPQNQLQSAFEAKKNPGIIDRLGENYVNRMGQVENLQNLAESGQMSHIESGGLQALKLAQIPIDTVTEAGMTYLGRPAAKAISFIDDISNKPFGLPTTKDKIKDVYSAVASSPVGELASNAVQGFQDYRQNHPVASARIGGAFDAGNIALAFLPGNGGKSLARTTLEDAGQAVTAVGKPLVKVAERLNTKTAIPSAQEVRQYAGDLFKKADAEGGIIPAPEANQFYDQISRLDKQTEVGQAFAGDSLIKNLVGRIDNAELRNKPLTFQAAKEADEALGELAYGTMNIKGELTADGNKALDAQRALRERVAQTDGGETLTKAREAWSTSILMDDVERIKARADRSEQPASSLRAGLRTLLNQSKKIKGANPEQLKALERAAQTGVVTDLFRLGGSGLVPIIAGGAGFAAGGLGGFGASIPAYALQQGSKKIATARQFARADKFMESSAGRLGLISKQKRIDFNSVFKKPVAAAIDAPAAAPLLLPAPSTRFVADEAGAVIPVKDAPAYMTKADRQALADTQSGVKAGRKQAEHQAAFDAKNSDINAAYENKAKLDADFKQKQLDMMWNDAPANIKNQILDKIEKQTSLDAELGQETELNEFALKLLKAARKK